MSNHQAHTVFSTFLLLTPLLSAAGTLHVDQEVRLTEVRQLTFGGENKEAYWSPDGTELIFQSTHDPYASYQLYSAALDGSDLTALADTESYDAEATVCSVDGSIVFTSTRDGDLDLYRMDADGANVKRLTETPGYDGGAFFSADCSQIVWRASRPRGQALDEYRSLLAEGLVRPGELEIWVANADGSEARQVTYLGGANFAPYFFPEGNRIVFSSNHHDPRGREFDIFAVNVNGTGLERITYTEGFDGFPMFSPDGKSLVFSSNRNQGKPGDTDVYVAQWFDDPVATETGAADRYLADVEWLADDQRGGRGLGTEGLAAAAAWLEQQFAAIGLEPAGENGGYRQRFEAVVALEIGPSTSLKVGGAPLTDDDFMIPAYSASAAVSAPVVFAGWGIQSEEHGINDYADLDIEGKVVLVRRFTPKDGVFENEEIQRRLGGIRYKAFKARELGAVALLIADLPPGDEEEEEEEAPFPSRQVDNQGDAGMAVAVIKRDWAKRLIAGGQDVSIRTELIEKTQTVDNIVGRLTARERLAGAVLIGAHYDHLGLGGSGSLQPDANEPHNGADDNASGTAALLEAARLLADRPDELSRDVIFVAFTGEEAGLLGSSELARRPLPGTAPAGLVAMLNMDMVGRLRNNQVAVLGSESAEEWHDIMEPLCADLGMGCKLSGGGYGPSDQTPFYAAGVPVLHFFTGAHEDYHKPSDDAEFINAGGGARVAKLVASLALELSAIEGLTYKESDAPAPQGDVRSYGASLGTIPDYTGAPDNKPGMLLAGVRAGGPADQAGLQRGDRIIELMGREIRDIYDLMYVLREAKPGEEGKVVAERGDEKIETTLIFGTSTRRN